MNKKKILITGSCGFIFGNFLRKSIYEKQPYQFVSLDKVNINAVNSMYWNKNHTFHIADIKDQHTIDVIFQFEKPDIVIHGAAETSNEKSLHDPSSFITSNILGTQNIINSCIKHKVNKLLFISTDKVYGNSLISKYSETANINPYNLYASSKMSGELLLQAARKMHKLDYAVARLSNNYGPRQSPDKLIPKTIKCILENKNIPVYEMGIQTRDWTHVFDSCGGILNILNQDFSEEIYNISSNQELTNIEVVQKICNIMNRGHDLITFDKNINTGHGLRYGTNSVKLRQLGWEPKIKLKDGLEQCVLWYLNNQWWFK